MRSVFQAIYWLFGAILFVGCTTSDKTNSAMPSSSASIMDASGDSALHFSPDQIAEIVRVQNHRVAGLKKFAARGSAELRWQDKEGDHFEQAQVDLAWRDGGQEISLRADKLGERLAWAGANAAQWWLFEPKQEPSRLWLGARDRPVPDSLLPFAGPDALLELLAALPWPENVKCIQDTPTQFTAQLTRQRRGEWVATRIEVSKNNAFPSHISLLGAKGNVLAESELTEPVIAVMNHLTMADRPLVASKITLKSISNVGTWQIFWDEPGAREDRLNDRLFDLAVIRSVMLPAEVIDLEKAPAKR